MPQYTEHSVALKQVTDDVPYKFRALEHMIRAVAPDPPTPHELAVLCRRYEDKVSRHHCEGKAAFDMPVLVAQTMAKNAQVPLC